MDTDSLLMPYCDISGECLLFRMRHEDSKHRPTLSFKNMADIGIPADEKKYNKLHRWVFFKNHPELSIYTGVVPCANARCVAAAHLKPGVYNGPMRNCVYR
jgi:hypothetical protein